MRNDFSDALRRFDEIWDRVDSGRRPGPDRDRRPPHGGFPPPPPGGFPPPPPRFNPHGFWR